jgi:membrane associated rhomboid family serine protease
VVLPLKDDNPTRTRPVLTLAIIAACVVIFAVVQPHDAREERFLYERAAVPCEITHAEPMSESLAEECAGTNVIIPGQPRDEPVFPDKNVFLAAIASMFLHGSWAHLLGNMLFLWIFGNNIEDRFGKVNYAAFYLLAGVAATVAHVATQANSIVPVIGASGAIAGVMGAYLVLFPHARVLTLVPLIIFIQFLYLPAWLVLVGWFLLQFLTNPNTGVAVAAHIGGFVVGAGITLLLRRMLSPPPPLSPDWG